MALCAIGLHFVVATALGFAVVYSDYWLIDCYVDACGSHGVGVPIYGFLIFDILLFLIAWGMSFILESRGWWRIVPPLAGTVVTVIAAATALYWVLAGAP